jgi:hypothetical protein
MPKRSSIKGGLNDMRQVGKDLAKSVGEQPPPIKNQAAVELGRLGGLKGGKARAEKLSPKKRKEIARQAALARWNR